MIDHRKFKAAYTANITTATITTPVMTATEPTTGAIPTDLTINSANQRHEYASLIFFGTDAANETGNYQAIGWFRNDDGLWTPVPLLVGTFTLGTATGVSGYTPADTDLIADTITVTSGASSGDDELYSPADNKIAYVRFKTHGAHKIQPLLDLNSSSASVNAMIAMSSES